MQLASLLVRSTAAAVQLPWNQQLNSQLDPLNLGEPRDLVNLGGSGGPANLDEPAEPGEAVILPEPRGHSCCLAVNLDETCCAR